MSSANLHPADVRAARLARNLTQVEAAAELNVSLRTFQGWEAGQVPNVGENRRRLNLWLAEKAAA